MQQEKKIYSTASALKKIGIAKSTYLRYVEKEYIEDVRRDGRGWRIFYDDDIEQIRKTLIEKRLVIEN